MKVSQVVQNIVCLTLSCYLLGCEGPKFITIENKTKEAVEIEINPGVPRLILVEPPKQYTSTRDTFLILPPDSTLSLITYFGLLHIFNEKIKQNEVQYNYLRIFSKKDTIIVNSELELFKLLKRKRNEGRITIK